MPKKRTIDEKLEEILKDYKFARTFGRTGKGVRLQWAIEAIKELFSQE